MRLKWIGRCSGCCLILCVALDLFCFIVGYMARRMRQHCLNLRALPFFFPIKTDVSVLLDASFLACILAVRFITRLVKHSIFEVTTYINAVTRPDQHSHLPAVLIQIHPDITISIELDYVIRRDPFSIQ